MDKIGCYKNEYNMCKAISQISNILKIEKDIFDVFKNNDVIH